MESDVKLVEEEDLFLLEVTGQLGVFLFLFGDFCSRFGSFGGGLRRGLSLGGNMALASDDLSSAVTALPADHPSSGGSVLAFGWEVA